jgi:signal peptidase II
MRILFGGAALVFSVDRLTKILALHSLDSVSTVPVWPGVFHLTLVHNTGVAFGLFRNAGWLLTAVSLAAAAAILFFHSRAAAPAGRREIARRLAWAFVAGGALGNAYDRIRFGAVIDFLDFRVWPVFNLADSAIVCGAMFIAASAFAGKES